jgi:Ca2+-binding EF-hand superfamily protein
VLLKSLLIAGFSFLGTLSLAADDEKKPPAAGKLGNIDKAKLFEKMDADGDGKVTKDEFRKFREQATEKLKDSGKGEKLGGQLGGLLDKLFEKMDADGDGKVTKEEFEKYQEANGGKMDREKLKGLLDKFKNKGGE